MIRSIPIFLVFLVNFAFAIENPVWNREMTSKIYDDTDFRIFVCGNSNCKLDSMQSNLDFLPITLRTKPDTVSGFIVTPKRLAENYYSSLFILHGNRLQFQFTFFGSQFGVEKESDPKGFKYLYGAEQLEDQQYQDYRFQWIDGYYEQIRSTKRK